MRKYMKYVFVLLAVAFLLAGIYKGESQTVLQKAVNICLECIGVG